MHSLIHTTQRSLTTSQGPLAVPFHDINYSVLLMPRTHAIRRYDLAIATA